MYECIPTQQDQKEVAKPVAELNAAFTMMIKRMDNEDHGKDLDELTDMQRAMAGMLLQWFKLQKELY